MTPSDESLRRLTALLARQRAAGDEAPGLAERRERLTRLRHGLLAHARELERAASADFGGRSRYETLFADVMPSVQAIDHARRHLAAWMRPRRRRAGRCTGRRRRK